MCIRDRDWTGAFGGSVNYKNWTLNTTFEFKAGNFVINNLTDAFRQANGAIGRNLPRSAKVARDYATGGVDAGFTPQGDGTYANWVNGIGNALIDNITLEIGGQQIDKHYAEWLDIWGELNVPESQKSAYDAMVGNFNSSNGLKYSADVARTFYTPLRFFFKTLKAFKSFSINFTFLAPLDIHSIPNDPTPE